MKFYKKRLKFVIPLTLSVVVVSTIMLINQYEEVPTLEKFFIVVGAGILTAVISYFLFPQPEDNPNDIGPY